MGKINTDLLKFSLSRCANLDVAPLSIIFTLETSNVLINGAEEMPLKRHSKVEVGCDKSRSGVKERPS